jgi:predicted MPP superfamily phosphohydrolase
MIARAPYLFLLLILIPDLYLDQHYWRHKYSTSKRLLHWLPSILLTALTVKLTYEKDFIPDDPTILYIYLLLLGLIAIPKLVYVLFSILGLGTCKLFRSKRNYGNLIGAILVPLIWYIIIYGSFVGFQKLEVNRHTYSSPDLPSAFNNYKIVLFSDAHVGTLTGSRQWMLQRAVDSINALRPDMIVFTGDLQNLQPKELYKQMDILSTLKAKDGIYSVLGNHDYAQYVSCSDAEKAANCKEIISLERQLGWTVLLNDHKVIQRGKDHLVIAGMENDGDGKHFPQKGDISKTLSDTQGFTILLEHDPSSWRRKIIPDGRAQLTLSGHTHKMQFAPFDWCPMSLTGKEFNGWYHEGSQSLFVTAGLGGLIPFRFDAPGEIVLIQLKR